MGQRPFDWPRPDGAPDVADAWTSVSRMLRSWILHNCLSEFGRRVPENGDYGLEHGYGNCMLVMGAGVRGGQVHTRWPGLGTAQLVDDDLAVTVDYRSVLSEVVRARFPTDASAAFPGFVAERVGVMA